MDGLLLQGGSQSFSQVSLSVTQAVCMSVRLSVCLSVCLRDWAIQGRRPSRHSLESLSVYSCHDHSLYQREGERAN